MSITLLFKGKPKPVFSVTSSDFDDYETVEIELDAKLAESHNLTSKVTSFPVEDGANITDHISLDPEVVTIEGFISDTPVRYLSGVRSLISGSKPTQTAFDQLMTLREQKIPFNVLTGFKLYTDMFFTNLTIPHNQSTGQALRFTAELKKIHFSKSKSVKVSDDVKDSPEGTKDQAQSTKDVGKQTPANEPSSSILHSLFN